MIGEVAALTCALSWAIAARMFKSLGQYFSPLLLNFWKGLITIILLVGVIGFSETSLNISNSALMWLLLSGLIGIGIGDTCFFQAINRIGDSQTILVAETLAPIFTAILAMAWMAEWLTGYQWLGITIVIFSVDLVVKYQRRSSGAKVDMTGYLFALLAAICQAIGAVISRDIMTTVSIDPGLASLYRLVGGICLISILLILRKTSWLPGRSAAIQTWGLLFIATFIGTFIALYLQMVAFTYTKAAVVQTLFTTSVILSLGIARLMGEQIKLPTLLWSIGALIGVAILILAP